MSNRTIKEKHNEDVEKEEELEENDIHDDDDMKNIHNKINLLKTLQEKYAIIALNNIEKSTRIEEEVRIYIL